MEKEEGMDLTTAMGGEVEGPSWLYRTEAGRPSGGVTITLSLVVRDLEGTLSARFRRTPPEDVGTTGADGAFQEGWSDGRFCSLAEDDLVLGLGPRSSLAEFLIASMTAPWTFWATAASSKSIHSSPAPVIVPRPISMKNWQFEWPHRRIVMTGNSHNSGGWVSGILKRVRTRDVVSRHSR